MKREKKLQPYDDVIRRLKDYLARHKEKLNKKNTVTNLRNYNETKFLLKVWQEERKLELSKK